MGSGQNKPPPSQQRSEHALPLTSSAGRTIALWGHDGADHHAGAAGVWLRLLRTDAVVLEDWHNTRALAQSFLCVTLPTRRYLALDCIVQIIASWRTSQDRDMSELQ